MTDPKTTAHRYEAYKIAAGPMFYIRDKVTGQLLVRPAENGGFVRFQHEEDAERYADGLNVGKGWPERFNWGGGR